MCGTLLESWEPGAVPQLVKEKDSGSWGGSIYLESSWGVSRMVWGEMVLHEASTARPKRRHRDRVCFMLVSWWFSGKGKESKKTFLNVPSFSVTTTVLAPP